MDNETRVEEIKDYIRKNSYKKNFWAVVELKLKNSFKCVSDSGISFRLRIADDVLFNKIDEGDILHLSLKDEEIKVLSIDKKKQKEKKK